MFGKQKEFELTCPAGHLSKVSWDEMRGIFGRKKVREIFAGGSLPEMPSTECYMCSTASTARFEHAGQLAAV